MAYFKTKQGGDIVTNLSPGTTGGATVSIQNYGITVIPASSAEVYAMQPPVAGVMKTLVFTSSSTVATAVKLSSNAAQTITVLSPTGSTYTVIKKAASASTVAATVVQLVGYNSTSWIMLNAWPPTTSPTAASLGGGITMSTT